MKNKIILSVFTFFVLVCTGSVVLALSLTPITLKRETFVYEYGSDISTDVASYINANDSVLQQATLNLSEVKNEIGTYSAYVDYAGSIYEFYIKIEDTTKPVVTLKQVVFNANLNETIRAYDLIDSVEDNSDIEAYFINDDGTKVTETTFYETGSFILNVLVEDTSGNQAAKLRVKFDVGTRGNYPTLLGIENIEVEQGKNFSPLQGVSASDGNGNDITSSIRILKNNVNTEKIGVYEVIYSITNSQGNNVQRTRKVEVVKTGSEKTQ